VLSRVNSARTVWAAAVRTASDDASVAVGALSPGVLQANPIAMIITKGKVNKTIERVAGCSFFIITLSL
jgi:hypothetical protein